MPAQEHYPDDWAAALPKPIGAAFHARDGAAIHRFARSTRARLSSRENQRLASVTHLLAFALDMVAVQEERLRVAGVKNPPVVRPGSRSGLPAITSGIRECKNPARRMNR